MKNIFKRIAAIILVFSLAVTVNAFESDAINKVYADTVIVENGKQVTIPVMIENNEGFMGFALFVTYDKDVFTPVSVSKGSILSGLFNDSISTSKTNSFKVVCSETGNVTSDGVLFNLKFDVADGVSGKYEIELSYSQQDTFNENWDSVILACDDIKVIVTENGTTVATTTTTTVSTTVPATEQTIQPAVTEQETTKPVDEETTTQPITEPSTDPSDEPDEKPLSVRMREWANGLPTPLDIIFGIFVIPVASFISLFE